MTIDDRASFERRLQSILQAIMLAILLGVGYTLIDLVKSSTRQEVTNAQVARDISDLMNKVEVLRAQGTSVATAAALAAATAAADAALAASNAVSAAARRRKES